MVAQTITSILSVQKKKKKLDVTYLILYWFFFYGGIRAECYTCQLEYQLCTAIHITIFQHVSYLLLVCTAIHITFCITTVYGF